MKTSSEHQQDRSLVATSNPVQRFGLLWVLLCAMALGMYACGDGGTGAINDNGNGNGNNNGNGDEIGSEPTFTNVGQIFQSYCTACHGAQGESGVSLNTYDNVIGSEGAQYGENVVQPGDAGSSPLVDKIEPGPQYGVRMPQGGPFLSNDRINQIREWIANGAEND
jgi:hypothetical protein